VWSSHILSDLTEPRRKRPQRRETEMADGENLIIGMSNSASQPTILTIADSAMLGLLVNLGPTFVSGENIAIHAVADSGAGVSGNSVSSNGVMGTSVSGIGIYGSSLKSYGIAGVGADIGVYARNGFVGNGNTAYLGARSVAADLYGDVDIHGRLTKSGGGFRIDHPLDPANQYLAHSFVESSEMKNVYDGIVVADEHGQAAVELPGWFEAVTVTATTGTN
jgi:hypothetical protein